MGKIFTSEQISNGQIPEPGAHEAAGRYILDEFFENEARLEWDYRPHIESGMVYGSTALGTAGLRSDVDVLAVYNAGREADAPQFINRVIREAENTFNIPVEISFRAGNFDTSPSTIDALFMQHLIEIQEQDEPRWSYNWPVQAFYWQHPSILTSDETRNIAAKYIGAKANQFAKSIVEYRGVADMRSFQRALELPKSIGRKVLAATDHSEGETQNMSPTGRLQNRLEVFYRHTKFTWVNTIGRPYMQSRLLHLDEEYDQLLQSTLATSTSLTEYQEWIDSTYLPACELAFSVSRMWQHIIANRIDQRANYDGYNEHGQGQLAFDVAVHDLRDDWVY